MASVVIINPNLFRNGNTSRINDWVWSDGHGGYIFEGREMTVQEHNDRIQGIQQKVLNVWKKAPYSVILETQDEATATVWQLRAQDMTRYADSVEQKNKELRANLQHAQSKVSTVSGQSLTSKQKAAAWARHVRSEKAAERRKQAEALALADSQNQCI